MDVSFTTSKPRYWPDPRKSHVNWIVTDSEWEDRLAQLIEDHPCTVAYAKNHNLGLEVPYLMEGEPRTYLPDFLIRLAPRGPDLADPTPSAAPETAVTLVIEVKGFRGHDAMLKAETMRNRWIPAVNRLGTYGRWHFAELRDIHDFRAELDRAIAEALKAEVA
jgi:type III restriction enzyme